MSRLLRVVVPGCPHHVTQRGNQGQDVFLGDEDRRMYLSLLGEHATHFDLRLLAWCLMSNHVHMVVVPEKQSSMTRTLARTQAEYSRWLHTRQHLIGHLWHNRYYSCPLDDPHLWEAIRYVEMNPVRAGMVAQAGDWPWSSARAHLANRDPLGLLDMAWWRASGRMDSWDEILRLGYRETAVIERLREATASGRPFGSTEFLRDLERDTGRTLIPQKRGRPPKEIGVSVA